MDVKREFSKKLKELRKIKGYTQASLAEASECSLSTIRDYENHVSFPGPEMILQLANAFQVKPSVLFDFDNEQVTVIGPFANSIKYLSLLNQLDSESMELVEAAIDGALEGQKERLVKSSLHKS